MKKKFTMAWHGMYASINLKKNIFKKITKQLIWQWQSK